MSTVHNYLGAGQRGAGGVGRMPLPADLQTTSWPGPSVRTLRTGETIRAALLWTESTELMEISAPALDAELASFGAGAAELDPATPRS